MPTETNPQRLVLLNGVYGAPGHFDLLREALPKELAPEVYTFRRHGLPDPRPSDAFSAMVDRLDRSLRQVGDAPFVLFGFSLGGALALEYLIAHPERVSALILLNSFDRFDATPLHYGSMPMMRMWPPTWTHPSLAARAVYKVPRMRRGLFHADASLATIEHGVRLAASEITQADVNFQLAHLYLPRAAAPPQLATIAERTPILLMSSRDDIIVPPRHTTWLAERMPAARRLPPFEGGHAFLQHDATELAREVKRFLREVDGGEGQRESA
jgi:pimeloyl-ACP methyl ester carboxylesterase